MSAVPSYEQIRNLLGRYTECMDLADFDGLASLFTDAVMTDFEGNEVGRGFEGVKANYVNGTQMYDGRPGTKHTTVNAQIWVDEEAGTAEAKSAYVVFQSTPNLHLQPIITGRYHDDFARDDDGTWYFTARRFAVDSMGDLSQHLTYALGDS
jgi:3-phenylpropionate/cinnamic acid dioxygenase small subunit